MPILKHVDFEVPGFAEWPEPMLTRPGYRAAVLATPGLVAHYGLGSDPTRDAGPNALHLTEVGAVTKQADGLLGSSPDGHIELLGHGEHMALPNQPALMLESVSQVIWLRQSQSLAQVQIMGRWNRDVVTNDPDRIYVMSIHSSGRFLASVNLSNSTSLLVIGDQIPAIGLVLMVAMTYSQDTGRLRLFINGELVKESVASVPSPLRIGSSNLNIGARVLQGGSIANRLIGELDEASLFNRALDEDEIQDLYQEGALA